MLTIKNPVRDCSIARLAFLIFTLTLAGCTPPGPKAFTRGKKLLAKGNYAGAVDQFKTATSFLPSNALAWHYLGLACQNAGQNAEAEKAYLRAMALNRDMVETRFNLGCLFLEENRLEEAKNQFTAYNLRRGANLEGLLRLGTTQLRVRDLTGAERSFSEALKLSPQNPQAFNGLGLARLQRGRPVEAAQQFAAACRLKDPYPAALLNLAVVRQQYLRDRPAALQAYRDYATIRPAPSEAAGVARLISELERETAPGPVTQAPQVAQINPPNAPAPNTRPQALANAQDKSPQAPKIAASATPTNSRIVTVRQERAAETPKGATGQPLLAAANARNSSKVAPAESIRLSPEPTIRPAQDVSPARQTANTSEKPPADENSPATPQASGAEAKPKKNLLQKLNPLNLVKTDSKSKSVASPSSSTNPDQNSAPVRSSARYSYHSPLAPAPGNRGSAEGYFKEGVQAHTAGKLQEAARAYRQATEADPSYFEAQFNLALVEASLGNHRAALKCYENALAIQPNSVDGRFNFASALRQAGYYLDAANEFDRLAISHPNDVRVQLALGNLYAQQLRDAPRARQHYAKVLELEPRNAQAAAIRQWLAANP